MRSIFFVFILSVLTYASSPTVFIGTYVEKDDNISEYLVEDKNFENWFLSKKTEEILNKKYSAKLDKLNILLKDEFKKNTKNIVSNNSIEDRKIGFFHLKTYQNITATSNIVSGLITFNITFVQLGEESNRTNVNNSFESRYTHGVTSLFYTAVDEKSTLYDAYVKGLDKAIGALLDSMIEDKKRKDVTSLLSSDIYFSIENFKVNQKIKELTNKIFRDEENARRQLLIMFQESLIKRIRKDSSLDDVVLLYPELLNKYLFRSWSDYVKRINKYARSSTRNKNPKNVIRKIKPICENKQFDGKNKYLNGYLIQAFLFDLKNKIKDQDKYETIYNGNSIVLSRIVLPIKNDKKVGSLSTPSSQIKKINMFKVEVEDTFLVSNSLKQRRDFDYMALLRVAMDELAKDTIVNIKKIVKNKKEKLIEYQKFCKE